MENNGNDFYLEELRKMVRERNEPTKVMPRPRFNFNYDLEPVMPMKDYLKMTEEFEKAQPPEIPFESESEKVYAKEQLEQGRPLKEVGAELGGLEQPLYEPADLIAEIATGGLLGASRAVTRGGLSLASSTARKAALREASEWGGAGVGFAGAAGLAPEDSPLAEIGLGLAGAVLGVKGVSKMLPKEFGIVREKALAEMALSELERSEYLASLKTSPKQESFFSKTILNPDWRVKALKKVLDPIVDFRLVKPGTRTAEALGGTTLREMGVPAIERMNWMPQMAFQKNKVDKQLVKTALNKVAENMNKLDVKERATAVKFMTGSQEEFGSLDTLTQDKILTAVKPLQEAWTDVSARLKPKHEELLWNRFQEEVGKVFLQPKDEITKSILRFVSDVDTSSPRALRRALKGMLSNPVIDADTKLRVQELYDLPATTVQEVFGAFREASEGLLVSRIQSMPGLVSPIPKAGYVMSKVPEFKGMWIDKTVEQGFRDLKDTSGHARRMYNQFFMAPWKLFRVVARFPTLFKNIGGIFIQNDIFSKIPLSPVRMDVYGKAVKGMAERSSNFKLFNRLTGQGGTWAGEELLSPVQRHFKSSASVTEVFFKTLIGRTTAPFAWVFQTFETLGKFAKFEWNLKHGLAPSDAAIEAVRTTFDYADVTKGVKALRETIMPFGTWTSKVVQRLPEAFARHPLRIAKYAAIPAAITSYSLDRLQISDEEFKQIKSNLPDYIQKGWFMVLPYRDEQNRLQLFDLTWWVPGLGDISELSKGFGGPTEAIQSFIQNPLLSLAADITRNTKRTGAPIYYDWEDNKTKLAKILAHMWNQTGPGWAPGGIDWNQWMKTYKEEPGALTPKQLGAAQFGLKVLPIDPTEQMFKAAARQKQSMREINSQMMRDFKKINKNASEEEIQEVFDYYNKKMLEVGLGEE